MFQRLLFLGFGLAALLWVMATPDQVQAQHSRGGFRSGFSPRPGFGMQRQGMGFGTHTGTSLRTHTGTSSRRQGVGMTHTTTMHRGTMNTPRMNTPRMIMPTMKR